MKKRYNQKTAISTSIIITVLLASNLIIFSNYSYASELIIGSIDEVTLTVLIDDVDNGSLSTDWGLSILVETANKTILYDGGPSPTALQNNAELLGKDFTEIDYTVLSHEHLDHYGGFEYLGDVQPNISVYTHMNIPPAVQDVMLEMDLELIPTDTLILSTGVAIVRTELPGTPEELALIVNIEGVGAVILGGCSHPGIENMVEDAIQELGIEPYLAIGGFHLFLDPISFIEPVVNDLINLGVDKICPLHCSGNLIKEHLAENYPDNFINGCVGRPLCLIKK